MCLNHGVIAENTVSCALRSKYRFTQVIFRLTLYFDFLLLFSRVPERVVLLIQFQFFNNWTQQLQFYSNSLFTKYINEQTGDFYSYIHWSSKKWYLQKCSIMKKRLLMYINRDGVGLYFEKAQSKTMECTRSHTSCLLVKSRIHEFRSKH